MGREDDDMDYIPKHMEPRTRLLLQPWFPTEDQIDRYIRMRNGNLDRLRERQLARDALYALHEAGLVL